MLIDRNLIAIEVLADKLRDCKVGVICKALTTIDPLIVAEGAAQKVDRDLLVAIVGYPNISFVPSETLVANVERAVSWRSTTEAMGRIVVFVNGEVHKLPSLRDFDTISPRDLTERMLILASREPANNQPETRFWQTLSEEAGRFPFEMVESFVQAALSDRSDNDSIPNNLWQLGLLRDPKVLQTGSNTAKERLLRNRDLIFDMRQLSAASRRRMNTVVLKATGTEKARLQLAHRRLMEFYQRGETAILRNLDISVVEELLKAGRPLPVSHDPVPNKLENQNKVPDINLPLAPDRPLRGQELARELARMAVSRDPESVAGLRELGESIVSRQETDQPTDDPIAVSSGFGGRTVRTETSSQELRALIGQACSENAWGGILATAQTELKEAVRHSTPQEFRPYDPENAADGHSNLSLFDLLRQLDHYVEPGETFSDALNRIKVYRKQLLSHLDLLLTYPLVLLGGYPEARMALDGYVRAYSDLLRIYKRNDAILHERNPTAARFVISELLRLDVIHVQTPSEWKAILCPLHPFHLWRFRETFNTVYAENTELAAIEQHQLSEALPNLPHILHFVVFSSEVTGRDSIQLPQSGSVGLLPTYENRTNRYLGTDGLDFLATLLRRWVDYAPYTKIQVRLGLIDVPNLPEALKIASEFLLTTPDASLLVQAYFTRNQSAQGELARLDFSDDDHELAELMGSGRLGVRIRQTKNLGEAVDDLEQHPVHIAYSFDQSQFHLSTAHRARELVVSPLVVVYEYEYDPLTDVGTIAPSSEANEGLFRDYHFLVEQAAHLPAGQHLRMLCGGEANVLPINKLLPSNAARWLAIADRVLTPYRPEGAIPLREQRVGQREVGAWAQSSSRTITGIVDSLRTFALHPDAEVVAGLINRFGHIAAEGLLSLTRSGSNQPAHDNMEKGYIGTVIAAAWYTNQYPDALIASLDSNHARQWLQGYSATNQRADLVGIRMSNHDELVVEVIEVKTRNDDAKAHAKYDPITKQYHISGGGIEQLTSTLETIIPIFGGIDAQPLFTPARREVLKYQLMRECFREVHEKDWKEAWFSRLRSAFSSTPTVGISCRALALRVALDEPTSEEYQDGTRPLRLVRIGRTEIQSVLVPKVHQEQGKATGPHSLNETSASSTPIDTPETPTFIGSTSKMSSPKPQTETSVESQSQLEPKKIAPTENGIPPLALHSEPVVDSTIPEAVPPVHTLPDRFEAEELSQAFLRACQSYRIRVDQCDPQRANLGPTVWRFYVRLSAGQLESPLRSALHDIGREMRRSGLLISRIPNSNEIALDVPRQKRELVTIERALAKLPAITSPEQLVIPIGVTPDGNDLIGDLSKLSHILVGGTTGAGKTILLYTILTALLQTHPKPTQMRLLLSTSKLEDFAFFENLPHLETGHVVTDAAVAVELLSTYINQVFDERQALLKAAECRDISEYNQRQPVPMAPLVVVVDEFADLTDQLGGNKSARDAFYSNFRRIAQLGRNKGVHLILCTQRPSADLVPTSIRNLMNGRIALHVNDATASRMILDEPGAEELQMRGDLLFKEQAILTRAQGYDVPTKTLISLLNQLK